MKGKLELHISSDPPLPFVEVTAHCPYRSTTAGTGVAPILPLGFQLGCADSTLSGWLRVAVSDFSVYFACPIVAAINLRLRATGLSNMLRTLRRCSHRQKTYKNCAYRPHHLTHEALLSNIE
jgi:hypothetical protein